ncbi:unnamed protein product [Protopolystoma xenopodis]|uniref:Uncharacterized protein n=1 Tax=Protopolystoma xenopodis TaxID=117903 RepID=A0A3S5C7X7_9PLAT|nr:unnamed protein product [Protopolystoma xenopodis]
MFRVSSAPSYLHAWLGSDSYLSFRGEVDQPADGAKSSVATFLLASDRASSDSSSPVRNIGWTTSVQYPTTLPHLRRNTFHKGDINEVD